MTQDHVDPEKLVRVLQEIDLKLAVHSAILQVLIPHKTRKSLHEGLEDRLDDILDMGLDGQDEVAGTQMREEKRAILRTVIADVFD